MLRGANMVRTGYLASRSPLLLGWFIANTDTYEEARAAFEEFTLAYAEGSR